MVITDDSIANFYLKNLHNTHWDETLLNADCPFCRDPVQRGLWSVFDGKKCGLKRSGQNVF